MNTSQPWVEETISLAYSEWSYIYAQMAYVDRYSLEGTRLRRNVFDGRVSPAEERQ